MKKALCALLNNRFQDFFWHIASCFTQKFFQLFFDKLFFSWFYQKKAWHTTGKSFRSLSLNRFPDFFFTQSFLISQKLFLGRLLIQSAYVVLDEFFFFFWVLPKKKEKKAWHTTGKSSSFPLAYPDYFATLFKKVTFVPKSFSWAETSGFCLDLLRPIFYLKAPWNGCF